MDVHIIHVIFSIVAVILDNILGTASLFYILYGLAVIIPSLAVSIRRLHDIGKSGWWILICIIPLIGAIWLLVLMVLDSNPGNNKYRPNPREV